MNQQRELSLLCCGSTSMIPAAKLKTRLDSQSVASSHLPSPPPAICLEWRDPAGWHGASGVLEHNPQLETLFRSVCLDMGVDTTLFDTRI